MVIAVEVIGADAAAGPLTAAAIMFPPEMKKPDGFPTTTKLDATSRERALSSVMKTSVATSVLQFQGDDLEAAHLLVTARVLERAYHANPAKLPRNALLKLRKDLRLPSEKLPVTITQSRNVDDWMTLSAWLLAWKSRATEMTRHAARHPSYEFDKNLGWLTPQHREALLREGPTPLHRSWCRP